MLANFIKATIHYPGAILHSISFKRINLNNNQPRQAKLKPFSILRLNFMGIQLQIATYCKYTIKVTKTNQPYQNVAFAKDNLGFL